MSEASSHPIRATRLRRQLLIGILSISMLGLAFSSGTEGAFGTVVSRALGEPSSEVVSNQRQLVDPIYSDHEQIPAALAATARVASVDHAKRPPSNAKDGQSAAAIEEGRVRGSQLAAADTGAPQSTEELGEQATRAAPQSTEPDRPVVATSKAPAPSTSSSSTDTTTTTTTTTAMAPSRSAATEPPLAPASETSATSPTQSASAPSGWVSPSATGHRNSSLHQFPGANDGPHGVTIDQAFLDAHAGAPWLSMENGRPVISRADASGRCLNILTTLTLRDSYINCPTRTQNDSWGYAGEVDDAPAVNVLGAENVVIEYNTITCSGTDAEICSRSVRVGARNVTIQYNDLSLARGAVSLFHGTVFQFNYAHDLSFGFDPTRAGNSSDNVTHNNVVNNLGYRDALVQGNYIVAKYGRVSAQPSKYRTPHFHGAYSGGIVEVGDPINGFVFTNYLHNGNGANLRILENYVEGAGRPFRCNGSSGHSGASCASDISANVFAANRFDDFNPPLFHDKDGAGTISGSCNVRKVAGGYEFLPESAFGDSNKHVTTGC